MTPRYQPADASRAPRYTGIRTFARCPQAAPTAEGVEAAVIGVPFDTATSMRPGARFGPAGIRDASLLLRPWHPVHEIDVFGSLSVVDGGDLEVTPPPARPRSAGCCRTRRSPAYGRCAACASAGSTSSRWRPRTTRTRQTTALVAANVGYELLALAALSAPAR